ncbi:MAG: GntR family transcriptional regulator [Anaerolineae bacterium]
MTRLQPIEDTRKTVAAIVEERIREAILSGDLPAGSRIDQLQLATDLQVSLVPVREALKSLEAEGFVQILPRRGAFVTATSIADMEDLYFARSLMEGQAAYHAAERLKDSELKRLSELMAEMDRALNAHDYHTFMETNREFHFIIYEAAGSRHLVNLITSLWDLAERYRYRYMFLKNQASIIQAEHQLILDACLAHDKRALRDSVVYHMNRTLQGVRGYLELQNTTE